MKITLFLSSVYAANAFIAPQFAVRSSTQLFDRVDSSEAVEAALKASKEFGPTSKEARVAWDIVEEMDSSDNSAAYAGGVSDDDCLLDDTSDACKNYNDKLRELSAVMEETKYRLDSVKTLANELRSIKLSDPKVGKVGVDTEKMNTALAAAKEATETHGEGSSESKLAWETVEEIASNDYEAATKSSLDEECLVESLEACEALDELSRVINLQKAAGYGS